MWPGYNVQCRMYGNGSAQPHRILHNPALGHRSEKLCNILIHTLDLVVFKVYISHTRTFSENMLTWQFIQVEVYSTSAAFTSYSPILSYSFIQKQFESLINK